MSLHKNTIGWPMVAAIGVSIVVAGQFSGWNYGLAAGWGNMAVAFGVMFIFYAGLLQCVAELSATWPSAGGLGAHVRNAFGEWAGAFVGIALGLGLIACTGAVASFIVAYASSALPMNETLVKACLFIGIFLINLRGAKDALWLTLAAGVVAVLTLLSFSAGVLPDFKLTNLQLAEGEITLAGVASALPFAMWMFLGVEHSSTAAEETRNPVVDMPRGLLLALMTLMITAVGVVLGAPGAAGIEQIAAAGDPLLEAIPKEAGSSSSLAGWIQVGALFGLLASFFSITYSASRQIYDVARAGYLTKQITQVNKRGTPVVATLIVVFSGFGLSLVNPERVLFGVVVMFTFTYVLTIAAFIWLRRIKGNVERGYRAFGGLAVAYAMLAISIAVFAASFKFDPVVLAPMLLLLVVALAKRRAKRLATLAAEADSGC